MNDKPYLLIDCNNLCHRNWHVLKHTPMEFDPIVFGMMRDICNLSEILGSTKFIFLFDGEDIQRKKDYPEYKANRIRGEEYKSVTRDILRLEEEILPALGFKNVFSNPLYEADDLIAFLCLKLDHECIIVSSDKDYYQMLDLGIVIWNPLEKRIVNADRFKAKYGIPVHEYVRFKSITGCSTDNIVGICGEKTALKYLKGELKESSKFYEKIMNGKETIKKNELLVTLPYSKLKDPHLKIVKDSITIAKWQAMCLKLKFDNLLNRVHNDFTN